MSNKLSEKKLKKNGSLLYTLIAVIFIYFMLFEFILQANNVLPKPTLVIESFASLFSDYGLLYALAVTTTNVYLSILVGYIIISLTSQLLIKLFLRYDGLFNGVRIFRYFPAFFYAILFAFWFPFSIIAEFIFAFLASVFFIGLALYNGLDKAKEEYILSAQNLGAAENKIYKDVIWKCAQPSVFESLKKLHVYLWVLILVYEFIGNAGGLGNTYALLLNFNDFASLFALAIIISILIWFGNYVINYLQNKLIYWEP